jgi:hypothetical protein
VTGRIGTSGVDVDIVTHAESNGLDLVFHLSVLLLQSFNVIGILGGVAFG